ncbi:MAG: alanine racemase, partial [Nitrospinaceae bacterium]
MKRRLETGVALMAVVKADAYGHGALPCARAAVQAGADCLGVGILAEGAELREGGLKTPIQVLGSIFPEEIEDLIHFGLSTTVCTTSLLSSLAHGARRKNRQIGVHLKVDTGMGRLGVAPDKLPDLVDRVRLEKSLRLESVFTHFATADEADPEFTRLQIERFKNTLLQLQRSGVHVPAVHAANSSALLRFPESHFTMVRPGLLLYGAFPSPAVAATQKPAPGQGPGAPWKPVMR